jgi:hypothetical protein
MALPNRRRWRKAWVISVRVPEGRAEVYPQLQHRGVLAVLQSRAARPAVEASMTALMHALILDSDDDRFDVLVDQAPHTPEWNSALRHAELDYNGLPVIVADRSRVRMTAAGTFEWGPEPWPPARPDATRAGKSPGSSS